MEHEARTFRALIEQRLSQLTTALERGQSGADGSVALDQSRVGRLSRMDALQQQAIAQGFKETLLREQRRLRAALARLEEGTFGLCCECGDLIARERLAADPGVPFCSRCQEALEAKHDRARR